MPVILLVVGLLLIIGLIVVHEFGHFIAARRGGVGVEEFGIFFPPRIYGRRTRHGWTFSINALPLGGFVKLKGEHDSDTDPGSFGASSIWTKTKIMAAGVVMNFVVALVLLTILALIGMPSLLPNQYSVKSNSKPAGQEIIIDNVQSGSPAAKAGLQPEDQLVAIGLPGKKLHSASDANNLPATTKSYAGETVEITYNHNGQAHEAQTRLLTAAIVNASLKTNNPKGYLGVGLSQFTLQRSTWSAPIVGVGVGLQATALTFQAIGHTLAGLGGLIAGAFTHNTAARQHGQTAATSELGGPVAIYYILKSGSVLGYQYMLFIIAIISLSLAIMNILPIPALDGGRLWITLIARAFKRPLSARAEELLNAIGFVFLISLMILFVFIDIHRY